jgi:hypothetical protein
MTEQSDEAQGSAPIFNMRVALEKFRTTVDTGRKSRKAKIKRMNGAVDKRTLRATGRTAQLNFKVDPNLKDRAQKAAEQKGIPLVEWMEEAIRAKVEAEGVGDA